MITLTRDAEAELAAFFAANPSHKKSIRVYFRPGGCTGPSAALAVDDADEHDMSEEVSGMTFVMDEQLCAMVGEVTIDLTDMGFSITTERPFVMGDSGGCSCGSDCGSCGGGCGCH